jgi:hypothetical protein
MSVISRIRHTLIWSYNCSYKLRWVFVDESEHHTLLSVHDYWSEHHIAQLALCKIECIKDILVEIDGKNSESTSYSTHIEVKTY